MCEEDKEINLEHVELKVSLWHPDRNVQEVVEDVTTICAIYYYPFQTFRCISIFSFTFLDFQACLHIVFHWKVTDSQ